MSAIRTAPSLEDFPSPNELGKKLVIYEYNQVRVCDSDVSSISVRVLMHAITWFSPYRSLRTSSRSPLETWSIARSKYPREKHGRAVYGPNRNSWMRRGTSSTKTRPSKSCPMADPGLSDTTINVWCRFLAADEEITIGYKFGVYDLLVLPPAFPYGGMVCAVLRDSASCCSFVSGRKTHA